MIYEETYRYLLRHVNSTEFDACLYSVLHMDWDGVIQSPIHQMAKGMGTTEKYLKKIFKKSSSSQMGGGRRIFIPVEQELGKYQFNLGPTGSFTNSKDRYCKKYRFFYSDAFRNLPLPAKRLVLMAAFKMSVNKSEDLSLNYEDIIQLGSSLAKRNQILDMMNIINQALGDIMTFTVASSTFTRKEILIASFRTGTLKEYLENRTERLMLRKTIYEAGYLEHIEDKVCVELERVGKYIFRSFIQIAEAPIKEELLKLARFVYHSSLQKLGSALNSNKHLLAEPKEASAYFSTIVYNEALKQMATYAHQAACIKDLIEREHFHREISEKTLERKVDYSEVHEQIEPIRAKYALALDIYKTLNKWCEDWVISRVKSVTGTNEMEMAQKRVLTNGQTISEYLNYLKKHTYDQLEQHMAVYQHVHHGEHVLNVLRQKKEAMHSYFAIQKDRIKK
ncbi:hypothetical protein ACQKL5_18530 [Peribacillus sp. NPDC097675]|uniref:hypothetical protein n=1 Tax=Peribacillus sp. NPDC097675 TaxID=3390618 RepID=UPI003CFFF802